MKTTNFTLPLLFVFLLSCKTDNNESATATPTTIENFTSNDYQDLVALFKEWRTFENPPLLNGAPDYTAQTFEKRWPAFKELQSKLQSIDTTNWSVENKLCTSIFASLP